MYVCVDLTVDRSDAAAADNLVLLHVIRNATDSAVSSSAISSSAVMRVLLLLLMLASTSSVAVAVSVAAAAVTVTVAAVARLALVTLVLFAARRLRLLLGRRGVHVRLGRRRLNDGRRNFCVCVCFGRRRRNTRVHDYFLLFRYESLWRSAQQSTEMARIRITPKHRKLRGSECDDLRRRRVYGGQLIAFCVRRRHRMINARSRSLRRRCDSVYPH